MSAKKMKVCFVPWQRISNYFFVRWRFLKYLFFAVACPFKAVSVVVRVCQKMFVQSDTVSSLQGANRVAYNEEGIKAALRSVGVVRWRRVAFNLVLCDENLSLLCGGMHDYKLKYHD